MKTNEILELVRAGYTKAEIDEMDSVAGASDDMPLNVGPESESDAARSKDPGQEPASGGTAIEGEVRNWLKDIKNSIDEQIAEIKKFQQEINVKKFNVGEDPIKQRTTRDVYKDVYQPAVFNVEEE